MLNVDVTRTTDPWGYYSEEYMENGELVVYYYDNTGYPIEVLDPASAPQNLAVGGRQSLENYHLIWDAPATDGGYDIWEYAVMSDWGTYGEDFWDAAWVAGDVTEAEIPAWDPFLEYQFYVFAYTEAGEGEYSDILGITAIDYCDSTTQDCDFESFFGDEGEEFYDYPQGWIGYEVSETTYHLEWDAPYDPYGFWGTPVGYIVFADNFEQGGRGEQWRAIAKVDGSEEWGNGWKMDVTNDMAATLCTPAPDMRAFGGEDFDGEWEMECWPEQPLLEDV